MQRKYSLRRTQQVEARDVLFVPLEVGQENESVLRVGILGDDVLYLALVFQNVQTCNVKRDRERATPTIEYAERNAIHPLDL